MKLYPTHTYTHTHTHTHTHTYIHTYIHTHTHTNTHHRLVHLHVSIQILLLFEEPYPSKSVHELFQPNHQKCVQFSLSEL